MMNRLREADRPHTAFVEARGDLRHGGFSLCENVATDPGKPGLLVASERNWRPVPHLQPTNRRLRSGDQSQKTIQYP
jgi:hypothetical protein